MAAECDAMRDWEVVLFLVTASQHAAMDHRAGLR